MSTDIFYIEQGNMDGTWQSGTVTGLQTFNSSGSFIGVRRQFYAAAPTETVFTSSYFVFDGLLPNRFIESAYMSLYNLGVGLARDEIIIRLYGIKNPNPDIPTTLSGIAYAPKTDEFVLWTIPRTENASGTVSISPDISSILNEIRTQPGFSSSSKFILTSYLERVVTGSFLFNGRYFFSYESGLPATLFVAMENAGEDSVIVWDSIINEIIDDNENRIDSVVISDTILNEVIVTEE